MVSLIHRLIAILGSAVLSVHISGQHEALIGNITVSGYQEGDADLALFKFPKGETPEGVYTKSPILLILRKKTKDVCHLPPTFC